MFITQLFNTRGLRDFYATCMTSSKLCWKPPCTARELILNHGFLPCKNSAPDPWSNRRHSPRQHGNFHDIFTGNLHQKHQKIMCSSRVFVCWVGLSPTGGQNWLEQYIPINTAMVGNSQLIMAHSWRIIKIKIKWVIRLSIKTLFETSTN